MDRGNKKGLQKSNEMTKQQEINAIYKSTLKDYRLTRNGKKMIMYFDNKVGSVLCEISQLPKEIYNERLKKALKK